MFSLCIPTKFIICRVEDIIIAHQKHDFKTKFLVFAISSFRWDLRLKFHLNFQESWSSFKADFGALKLQPHFPHGTRGRNPHPDADGPAHHARDCRRAIGAQRRIAVLALVRAAAAATAATGAKGQIHVPAVHWKTAPVKASKSSGSSTALNQS